MDLCGGSSSQRCGRGFNAQRNSPYLINGHGCGAAVAQRWRDTRAAFTHQRSPPELRRRRYPLAEREAARVDVHLGDPDESERGGQAQARGDRALAQQVRQLVALLEAKGGVVEHAAMRVARLLDLQLVDVVSEPHELLRQLLILQAHVCLQGDTWRWRETGETG